MPKVTGLGHVGLYVKDPDVMIDFYSDFLGMTVSDRAEEDRIVFLSTRPKEEHHELVLFKDETRHSDVQQLSFTVGSLADLRAFYAQIEARGYLVDRMVNHGNAFGCYFRDPEDNEVEVYWHTGKSWPQPYGDTIDLSLSEEELLSVLDRMPEMPVA
jgi:catechol 2,3-dioxygenase-like lactoylglutathione lyase family enzyme